MPQEEFDQAAVEAKGLPKNVTNDDLVRDPT